MKTLTFSFHSVLIPILSFFSFFTMTHVVEGTPLLALKEAENCGACHNKGRSQRPIPLRRCTLDCAGCHVDPAGAGPRNQWGYYYSQAEMNAVHFFKPQDPLQDTSRFDLHYDGRIIQRNTHDGESRTFPMSSELSLRLRPFIEYVHLVYQGLYMGRIDDGNFSANRKDPRRFREKYALMIDQIPFGTYVRAYRGPPMYGIRRSNHSLWIRERLGMDQFASTEAVEVGGTPNVPFLRWSLMQGDPYAEPEDRQKGTSFHGGLRGVSWGWHLNTSFWNTKSEKASVKMTAFGAGASPYGFILYGERNFRQVEVFDPTEIDTSSFSSHAVKLHPSSTIAEYTLAYSGVPGLIFGTVFETLDDPNQASSRRNYFIDLHPIPFLQFELWRRFETGTRELEDTLGVLHAYFDF